MSAADQATGIPVLDRVPPPADARIPYGDEPLQFGDLRLPAGVGPFPAVAFVHGGFWRARWDLTHAGNPCAALTAAGFATWNVEYRRIGIPGGAWPGTFRDVRAGVGKLFDLAERYPIDPDRIVVVGHSAGGHLALWVTGCGRVPGGSEIAAPPLPLRGAVSLSGAVDLQETWRRRLGDGVVRDLLGGTPEEVPERYAAASPAELLPLGVRQLLVHGALDDIVPLAISEGYVAAARAAGDAATLLALPDAEHFAVIDPESPAWPRVLAAVQALLHDG